jgi:hypothetical protein
MPVKHFTILAAALLFTAAAATPLHAQNRDSNRDRRDRSPFGQGPRSQYNSGSRSNNNNGGDRNTGNSSNSSNTPPSTQPTSYTDRYAVLAERNIFLRERRRPQPDRGPRDTTREARKPEQTFALTGIVEEEGEFRAYFENLANPSFTRVSLGEPIARGKITAIAIDAVEYEQDGQRKWIDIGHDLTGTLTATAPSSSIFGSSAAAAGTTSPTTQSLNFDPNDPNLTTEQKMKLRAMQQRGQIK